MESCSVNRYGSKNLGFRIIYSKYSTGIMSTHESYIEELASTSDSICKMNEEASQRPDFSIHMRVGLCWYVWLGFYNTGVLVEPAGTYHHVPPPNYM